MLTKTPLPSNPFTFVGRWPTNAKTHWDEANLAHQTYCEGGLKAHLRVAIISHFKLSSGEQPRALYLARENGISNPTSSTSTSTSTSTGVRFEFRFKFEFELKFKFKFMMEEQIEMWKIQLPGT